MNHCGHEIKELLPLYVDHELTEEDMFVVENHIKDCEECRIDLELYQSIKDELDLTDIKLPENFHHELMNKLALENEIKEINAYQTSFFVKYMRYINLVALFTVVVFIGLAGLNRNTKSDMELATFDSATAQRSVSDATNEEAATTETMSEEMVSNEAESFEAAVTENGSEEMKSEVAVMQVDETTEETMLEMPAATEETSVATPAVEDTTESTVETNFSGDTSTDETTSDATASGETLLDAAEPNLKSNEKMMVTAEEETSLENTIDSSETTLTINGNNATVEPNEVSKQNWFLWLLGGILVIVFLGGITILLLIRKSHKNSTLNKKS